jgi:hypothetical protein
MRRSVKWPIVVVLAALAVSTSASAAGSRDPHVFTVGSLTVPGVDTGLVLEPGQRVKVTATGVFCPGTGFCADPEGSPLGNSYDQTWGGFTLPGAPAYGLIGRVGEGPWVHVGTGPTTLTGAGALVFAVNDDLYPDNTGGFTATVTPPKGKPRPCERGSVRSDETHKRCDRPDRIGKP